MLKMIKNIFIAISVLLLAGACAPVKVPPQKIAKVETAISRAEDSTAVTYAPLQLRLAEDKFQQAKTMMDKGKNQEANRLLDEALVDAQLAEARSRSEKEKIEASKMRDSIDALRREIKRQNQTP